jgi:DNA excision repair protein ERCC-6-like
MIDTMFSFLKQILKKICDHPLLLTKKAAEGVLEGMDEMLNDQEKGMVQKMAMNLADMTNEDDGLQVGGDVSCKLIFIMSLLVSILECMPIFVVTSVVSPRLNSNN